MSLKTTQQKGGKFIVLTFHVICSQPFTSSVAIFFLMLRCYDCGDFYLCQLVVWQRFVVIVAAFWSQ